jgi:hypothetical protein
LFGVQSLTVVCIVLWAVSTTFLLLWLVNKVTPLRMEPKDEILGADYTEHNIQKPVAMEATANSSSNGRGEESQISQRPRNVQSEDDNMAGMYKTYFTDESTSDRSKSPARINLAYQHDTRA